MRKLTSFLLVLVMVFTMLPHQALASEAAEGTSEESIVDTTAPVEEPTPTQTSAPTVEDPAPIVEDPAPIVENLTPMETESLSAGNTVSTLDAEPLAEEEAKGLPIHYFLASPGNITNPNGSYVNYYGPDKSVSWWPESYALSDLKDSDSWNQIYTQQGIRNVYDESVVTRYVASWPNGDAAAFKDFGSVTINGRVYTDAEYEIKWVSIMCRDNDSGSWGLRCSQSSYKGEHIHIDGLLVEKIQPGEMEVFKMIPAAVDETTVFHFTLQKMRQANLVTPPTSADAVDTSFAPMTLTASIPAGQTEAQITGGSEISFGYYKLTENSHEEWQNAGIILIDQNGRIILTTHYMEEAEALSDRIGIMKSGKLLAAGTAEELKQKAGTGDFETAFVSIVKEG